MTPVGYKRILKFQGAMFGWRNGGLQIFRFYRLRMMGTIQFLTATHDSFCEAKSRLVGPDSVWT